MIKTNVTTKFRLYVLERLEIECYRYVSDKSNVIQPNVLHIDINFKIVFFDVA